MRVLFTTTQGRGHVQPMLPLAHALRETGHEVRWAAAEPVCVRLRDDGFDATPAGPDEIPMIPPTPEIAALPPQDRPKFMFARVFTPRVESMLADLIPLVEDWRPAVLVCDQAELAGPIAAARAGVPNVTHSFGRLLPPERLLGASDALADIWRANGLDPRPYAGTYDHLYIDIYPPSMQAGELGHIGEIQLIRPAEPLERVPADKPLVYITFGTVFNMDLQLFADAVEAARELDVRVVVTLGHRHDPSALGEQPENVRVAQFIPQETLLPECAAVVSHAGSGTFLAAIAAGVPQVLLPQAADQFLNAEAGADSGVGVALWPGEQSVAKMREAITRVIGEEGFRRATEDVRDEIAAMPSPEEVAGELARRFA